MKAQKRKTTVGAMIREWRRSRDISQLDLACNADISTRHLSFLETGRARPSRDMLHQIAQALDMPTQEMNALLIAAGFSPVKQPSQFDSHEMASTRTLVQRMLIEAEPFCAAAIDRHWNILAANDTYWTLTDGQPSEPDTANDTPNLLKRLFATETFRSLLTNWEEVAYSLIQRLHREAIAELSSGEHQSAELLEHLMTTHRLPQSWQVVDISQTPPPLVPMKISVEGKKIDLITTITTLGTPLDASRNEIRIESFLPADDTSKENWQDLFATSGVA
jgi:transcriptional regulator with XRE-family HTH domain